MADSGRKKRGNRETKDERLLMALASGASVAQASKEAGISERTAQRRMDEPGFVRRLQEARAGVLDSVLGRLSFAAVAAVETLRTLVTEAESESVKLGAARAILEHVGTMRKSVELEQRVAEVERRLPSD